MGVIYPWKSKHRVVNPVLDGIMAGLMNAPGSYIADKLMQPIQAPREGSGDDVRVQTSGSIFTVDSAAMFGVTELNDSWPSRSSPDEVPGVQLGSVTYNTERYALKATSDDEMEIESQAPLPLSMLDLQQVIEALRIKKELRRKTLFFTSGNWSTSETLVGGDQWSNAAGAAIATADPVSKLRVRVQALGNWGVKPNAAIFGRAAYEALYTNPAILEFLPQSGQRVMMDENALKGILSLVLGIPVSGIHFGEGRYNTARTGATASLSDIWTDAVWIGRLVQKPAAVPESAGSGNLNIESTAAVCVEAYPMMFEQYALDDKAAKVNRVKYREDAVVVQAQAGTLLLDTQAA